MCYEAPKHVARCVAFTRSVNLKIVTFMNLMSEQAVLLSLASIDLIGKSEYYGTVRHTQSFPL